MTNATSFVSQPNSDQQRNSGNNHVQRWLYLDILRILAALAVIVIHVTAPVVTDPTLTGWWWANFANAASRWSVPAFIMISGALLLNSSSAANFRTFYPKRLLRLGIPLVFWTLIYMFVFNWLRGDPASINYTLHRIFFDQPHEHFYFIYILLAFSLITPPLYWLLKKLNKLQSLALIFGTLILMIFWQESRFLGLFPWPYIGYYLLGYWMHKYINTTDEIVGAFFSFVCWLIIAVGTYLIFSDWLLIDDIWYFYNFINWPVLLFTTWVFFTQLSLQPQIQTAVKTEQIKKQVINLSQQSYGIYLIHPLILLILSNIFMTDLLSFNYIPAGIIFIVLVTFILSLALTKLLATLPFIKMVV